MSCEDVNLRRIDPRYRTPLGFFSLWVILEFAPVFVPSSFTDELYSLIYFACEDTSTVALALACYFALSYTSTILKGVSLSAVIVAANIAIANNIIGLLNLPEPINLALFFTLLIISLHLFLLRFMLRLSSGKFHKPEDGTIYLIVTKPHNFLGMLGLFWSGLGGGSSVYVDGVCYWFSSEKGALVKTTDPDWYKGKRMIDCGRRSPDKIAELDKLVGMRWSIWNNCFTVFARWRREWSS